MNTLIIIMLFFLGIVIIPTAIVFIVLGIAKHRRRKKYELYDCEVQGLVERFRRADQSRIIFVQYTVDGQVYTMKETVKYKSEAIKAGKVPIGQHKTPVMGAVGVGDYVTVKYLSSNPQKALIKGNDGSITG